MLLLDAALLAGMTVAALPPCQGGEPAPDAHIVHHVLEGDHVVDVVYEGAPWAPPRRGRLTSARITDVDVAATQRSDEELVAVAEVGGAPCAAGAGDELVDGVLVVGVLSGGVLVESGEELFFVPLPDEPMPTFRLTWRSSFALVFPSGAPTSPPVRGKKPPKRRGR